VSKKELKQENLKLRVRVLELTAQLTWLCNAKATADQEWIEAEINKSQEVLKVK
jgi:hypothetical protein